jgi:hypothetical protein
MKRMFSTLPEKKILLTNQTIEEEEEEEKRRSCNTTLLKLKNNRIVIQCDYCKFIRSVPKANISIVIIFVVKVISLQDIA